MNTASIRGLASGLVAGTLIAAAVAGAYTYWTAVARIDRIRDSWNLVPVLIVEKDLPGGAVLTMTDLGVRDFPQMLVGSAMLPHQLKQAAGRQLEVPVSAGEPVVEDLFQSSGDPGDRAARQAHRACAAALRAAGLEAREASVGQVRSRLEGEHP